MYPILLVKNRHLAKSISDAGWSTFRQRWGTPEATLGEIRPLGQLGQLCCLMAGQGTKNPHLFRAGSVKTWAVILHTLIS
ncbi:hypothetical protein [aff. Roholtiella sp. LEGE 12411]|uniref:hypothetical protein n=1 Tax=aff. Roholtiella sp. LEGE 12411 TaxID=1828822 RepID=UPI001ABC1482|nr:hypothetical protein [aff. Roholtiella sp. LEGE 12411]